jgi:mannose-6-phosphate isomerase-like protein (cupin superfamily)
MKQAPVVLGPSQYPPALSVVGMQITVLADNLATRSYGITLQQGDGGKGPRPHSHDWDEAFFVLEGSVRFRCGTEEQLCGVGTLVHVPRGTVHSFSFGAGGGRMLEVTGAGSLAAQMFTALDREVPPGPPDVAKLNDLLKRNGVTIAEYNAQTPAGSDGPGA